ncbi:MAG: hypothetical protein KAH18_13000 [Psychromonas sp.]|nr:hypothetical protein [Psychromonas sp.]
MKKSDGDEKNCKKLGGQKTNKGATLTQVAEPDHIIKVLADRWKLPKGNYETL